MISGVGRNLEILTEYWGKDDVVTNSFSKALKKAFTHFLFKVARESLYIVTTDGNFLLDIMTGDEQLQLCYIDEVGSSVQISRGPLIKKERLKWSN